MNLNVAFVQWIPSVTLIRHVYTVERVRLLIEIINLLLVTFVPLPLPMFGML